MPRRNPASTEVDAYVFIKNNLKEVGWDVRNPERAQGGRVWTQNECLSNSAIKACLHLDRPENIVKLNETALWVIEAKRTHAELAQALREAESYARELNKSQHFQVAMISGVAGNDHDTFIIRTRLLVDGDYLPVQMNGIEATALLSPEQAEAFLRAGKADLVDAPINERHFIARAEHINEILHLGAVNPHQRASVMAALLLSMLGDTSPNINESSPSILINDINSRVKNVLDRQNKSGFYDLIKIALPTTTDNHVKFRHALVESIQELNNLNIRSAMNSGVDWLGVFYEVFLKYASWAQDLGIVLTPRHITRYAAEVLDIGPNDIVYDPTCGTGGFLVSAFDHVKTNATPDQIKRFKKNSLFGVEQDPGIASLAIVNMIFRGDGKNNIVEGNCFAQNLKSKVTELGLSAEYTSQPPLEGPVTKVMMNPPFSLKGHSEKEYKFVDKALDQMEHGGLLFALLPYGALVKPSGYRTWREKVLLPNHTVLSVITFPEDIFYPVLVRTVGLFIKKGTPHRSDANVLWLRASSDGLSKSKGRRLTDPRAANDLSKVKEILRSFLHNPDISVPTIDRLQKACPIDMSDPLMEIVAENYLDDSPPETEEIVLGMEKVVRDCMSFLIKARMENVL